MTGKDLIIYILENHLEDVEIFKNGEIPGYVTVKEAAIMTNAGVFTIEALISLGRISAIKIGDKRYIPIKDISQLKI